MIANSRRMFDTGLQWLGTVPADWRRVPLWTLFRRVKRTGFEGEPLLSVYRDHGVVPKASRDDNFNKPSDDLSLYQLVEEGDLAINKMKAWQGSAAISGHRGIVSPAYFVFSARHSENPRFLHYLFRSAEFTAGYLSISKGIRPNQWDLEPQEHSRMLVPLPSVPEQGAIAAFLDRETGKIDALVEEQRRLIELLKEKRQAVISHAVTKGLDPNAKVKPSGVEWLGDVPEHWEVRRIKSVLESIDQGWSPQCEGYPATEDEWGVLKVGCVNGGTFDPSENKLLPPDLESIPELGLRKGDVLVSRANTRDLVGSAALITEDHPRLMICDKLYRLRTNPSACLPEFLALFLGTPAARASVEIEATGASSSMLNIAQGTIRGMAMALPPSIEQAAIVNSTAKEVDGLDLLASHARTAIRLLQERRSALISAAVTGKIDVRRTAADQEEAA